MTLVSIAVAAYQLGVTPGRVRQFIAEGRMPVERGTLAGVLVVADDDGNVPDPRKKAGRPAREQSPFSVQLDAIERDLRMANEETPDRARLMLRNCVVALVVAVRSLEKRIAALEAEARDIAT